MLMRFMITSIELGCERGGAPGTPESPASVEKLPTFERRRWLTAIRLRNALLVSQTQETVVNPIRVYVPTNDPAF